MGNDDDDSFGNAGRATAALPMMDGQEEGGDGAENRPCNAVKPTG